MYLDNDDHPLLRAVDEFEFNQFMQVIRDLINGYLIVKLLISQQTKDFNYRTNHNPSIEGLQRFLGLNKQIPENTIGKFISYLIKNEYDTDGIFFEIEDDNEPIEQSFSNQYLNKLTYEYVQQFHPFYYIEKPDLIKLEIICIRNDIDDHPFEVQINNVLKYLSETEIINKANIYKISGNVLQIIYNSLNIKDSDNLLKDRIIDCINEIERQEDIRIIPNRMMELRRQKSNGEMDTDELFSSESLREKSRHQFFVDSEYLIIKNQTQTDLHELLKNKSKLDLKNECIDKCCSQKNNYKRVLWNKCPSIQRIKIMLNAHNYLMRRYGTSWNKIAIASIMSYKDIYGYQQLVDDFLHVKIMHVDADNIDKDNDDYKDGDEPISEILYNHFKNEYKCDVKTCAANKRHYKQRIHDEEEQILYARIRDRNKSTDIFNNEDVVFQQECDKIHFYFLHSSVPSIPDQHDDDIKINDDIDADEKKCIQNVIDYSAPWWKGMGKIDDNELYAYLATRYGLFSWQSVHGFRPGDTRRLSNLQPKYNNIKEEALYNIYQPLSVDNWNQTLRKSTAIFKSWARNKIRTFYPGKFEDRVTGYTERWQHGVVINLAEIVTLKLYTDFAKLQKQLKKCFRFNPMRFTLNDNKHLKYELLERLKQFYNWRGSLLIVLNKFGIRLSESKLTLYHGVDAKMLLNPSPTLAFWGPLSTSTSYHVAKTFASKKGMVLKLSSQYPRLNYCNAFNASLISDYPEENEWLIGFMYLRVLQVRTRPVKCPWDADIQQYKQRREHTLTASWMRSVFFSVHLFKQQIFSMSEQLEDMLQSFIHCGLGQCCSVDANNNPTVQWMCQDVCNHKLKSNFKNNYDTQHLHITSNDYHKKKRIYKLLWKEFNEFRNEPNKKQCIKIDTISDKLKVFFLENNKISFKKIIKLFPNIEEIHLINQYILDQNVLDELVEVIKVNKKLNKVYFLYYDYQSHLTKPLPKSNVFEDPALLCLDQLNDSGWKLKSDTNGKIGWKIQVINTGSITAKSRIKPEFMNM